MLIEEEINIEELRNKIKKYFIQHNKRPSQIIIGEEEYIQFCLIFTEMRRQIPSEFDTIPIIRCKEGLYVN